MNNTYVKQKLDELHLIDDFLFFQMMNHPKYGAKFSRLLLRLILGRDVGKLYVIPQKEYYGEDTDLHGARLDVYLEEEEPDFLLDFEDEGVPSVYDLEPEKKKDLEARVIHRKDSGNCYSTLMEAVRRKISNWMKQKPWKSLRWLTKSKKMQK